MLFRNVHIIGRDQASDIRILGPSIHAIGSGLVSVSKEEVMLDFRGALAFPGLINSHDHLDFDLFPQIGNRIYNNYIEWGADIQVRNANVIDEILRIPKDIRVKWGLYRNLLNGFTTVVNHGPKLVYGPQFIRVIQDAQSLHSVGRESNWRLKLNNPFAKNRVVAIHTGEGTDKKTQDEIDNLIRWNVLKRKLVAVHGVAMTRMQAKRFTGLVWCPASNYFLLGHTAPIKDLKEIVMITFGTDSTLTAPWNAWDQLRQARDSKLATDGELFQFVTTNASKLWSLSNIGEIGIAKKADIVVAKPKQASKGWDSFYGIDPEDILMVVQDGRIRLFDITLFEQLSGVVPLTNYYKITIKHVTKFVEGDLPSLVSGIKKYSRDLQLPIVCD